MKELKLKYKPWDKAETIFWTKWYIHAVNIQKDDTIYELWMWDTEYWNFSEWQLKPSKKKNIGFNVNFDSDFN